MSRSERRVVVTGMGVVCPLGLSPAALWQALAARQSAVTPYRGLPTDGLPTSFAAEAHIFTGAIDEFGPLEGEKKKAIRKGLKVMCRESQMGVAAAQLALVDAGVRDGAFDPDRAGVGFGSDYMVTEPEDFTAAVQSCRTDNKFDFSLWAKEGLPRVTPLWLLKYLPNMPASHVAIYNDMRGPNNSITVREASANLAVGEAMRTIARGSADLVVAGATGTRVHPMRFMHTLLQEEVAGDGVDPQRASRPFDKNRSGMVLGEGAGALVLEELSSAQARGARILAEVTGMGSSSVAARRGAANRGVALANVMRAAMRDAHLGVDDVGHVHAHGISTHSSDADEAQAIERTFAARRAPLPVVTAKGHFGNLGAASGMVELIASIMALGQGRLFPVLNYETPDPECPLHVVTDDTTPAGKSVLNINVTPQGQASAVVACVFSG